MADVKINVVAKDMASQELKKVEGNLKGMGEAAEGAGSEARGMGTDWTGALIAINQGLEIAHKAIEAFKKAYDFAKEGAQLEFIEGKFDNLAASIGTTSNALMIDLKDATRGLMSDAEIMQGATDMMALGLASSHDEAVRLTAVAGALNMNMDQLTLTLTNKTIRRFDTLGISVAGFTEKVEALEAAGMSADDAFKEAFLQQAEAQIERVGHAADSAAGDFERLEASIANMGDNMKRSLAETAAPAVQTLADAIEEGVTFQTLLNMAVEDGVIDQQEYATMLGQARQGVINQSDAIQELKDRLRESADEQKFAADMAYGYAVQAAIAAGATWEEIEALLELEGTVSAADAAMRKYNDALLFKMASEGLSSDAALALARSMGLVDERTVYATEKIEFWRDKLEAGQITEETYNAIVKNLADNLDRIEDKSANIEITWSEFGRPSPPAVAMMTRSESSFLGGDIRMIQAAGGPIHAARGLSVNRPVSHWVGEIGPEPFFPAVSGRIVSNSQAVQALREGGGRGTDTGSIVVNINTPVNLADKVWVEQELAPYIRDGIRRAAIRG